MALIFLDWLEMAKANKKPSSLPPSAKTSTSSLGTPCEWALCPRQAKDDYKYRSGVYRTNIPREESLSHGRKSLVQCQIGPLSSLATLLSLALAFFLGCGVKVSILYHYRHVLHRCGIRDHKAVARTEVRCGNADAAVKPLILLDALPPESTNVSPVQMTKRIFSREAENRPTRSRSSCGLHHMSVDITNVDPALLNGGIEEGLVEAAKQILSRSDFGGVVLSSFCRPPRPTNDDSRSAGGVWCTCLVALEGGLFTLQAWPRERMLVLNVVVLSGGGTCSIIDDVSSPPPQDAFDQLWASLGHQFGPFPTTDGYARVVKRRCRTFAATTSVELGACELASDRVARRISGYRKDHLSINDDEIDAPVGVTVESMVCSETCHACALGVDVGDANHEGSASLIVSASAFHEALVHPGMFSHPKPRELAIVGGHGCGICGGACHGGACSYHATLREVLKHRWVEHVTVIGMLEFKHELERHGETEHACGGRNNDCSDMVGFPPLCSDDSRVDLSGFAEPIQSFSGRREKSDIVHNLTSPFDVVIVNSAAYVEWCTLDEEQECIYALSDSLTDDGILIMPVGATPFHRDAAVSRDEKNRAKLIGAILNAKFKSILLYEESLTGVSEAPQLFLVACKNSTCRQDWYSNEADYNQDIQRRMPRTKSGEPALTYFDGSTMGSYRRPPKALETGYCRSNPNTVDCREMSGFDPLIPNVSVDKFEVKNSTLGENAGRGLFTMVDIAKGSYVLQDVEMHMVNFPPFTAEVIEDTIWLIEDVLGLPAETNELRVLTSYMIGYGYESNVMGGIGHNVDSNIGTFMNHGCNGTYNFGFLPMNCSTEVMNLSENSIDLTGLIECQAEYAAYRPVLDRRLEHALDGALRDIKKGEEMLTNYLFFTSSKTELAETVKELQRVCRGESIGLVSQLDRPSGEGVEGGDM